MLPLSKIDYLPHFAVEGTEAYGPQRASEQRQNPGPPGSEAHTPSASLATTVTPTSHGPPLPSAKPLLTQVVSCSGPPPVLPWGWPRWLHAHWAWSLRPQHWAQGGQKSLSPAPVSSSKSHRSYRKMGCQGMKG